MENRVVTWMTEEKFFFNGDLVEIKESKVLRYALCSCGDSLLVTLLLLSVSLKGVWEGKSSLLRYLSHLVVQCLKKKGPQKSIS